MLFQKLCTENHLYNAWLQVKSKRSAGGVDGFSVLDFDNDLQNNLRIIQKELLNKNWNPEPYLRLEIKKNEKEKRKLGLLTIKDKIVQQAILNLVENNFEKIFLNNSYAYRRGKGHLRAVRRTINEFQSNKNGWVLKLDIDDYFDTINHEILFAGLKSIIPNEEIIRLIELSVKMGVVTKNMKWSEIKQGVPQGAVLSPLLANFYLHSFDLFVTSKTNNYIRYADDFLIISDSEKETKELLVQTSGFLEKRLLLRLNNPILAKTQEGINFLGVFINNKDVSINDDKKNKLLQRIDSIELRKGIFTEKSLESLDGIKRYYAQVLPQDVLMFFDNELVSKITKLIKETTLFISNKQLLTESLKEIPFFSRQFELGKKKHINEWLQIYSETKKKLQSAKDDSTDKNKKLINQKKLEYQKKESEGAELVISSYGSFVGKANNGITVKLNGKNIYKRPSGALKHITILSKGVTISSDAIYYCMKNNIPIDFFESGALQASILSPVFVDQSLWQKQISMPIENKAYLAMQIVVGKMKNHLNLIKYFHKYHKSDNVLTIKYAQSVSQLEDVIGKIKLTDKKNPRYAEVLITFEAQGANAYWSYIRQLLADDNIDFEKRTRKGATDLFNSLLNYGYSILYSRMWQAVLSCKLNPSVSVLHAQQSNKPTLTYDLIELFRAQAVDRVVISLIQKNEPLGMDKTLLNENTRKLLVKNILERINRYEKYRSSIEMKFSGIIKEQVREFAEYVDGQKKSFKPYIAKW